jgi:DNA polymerase III subunit gamma/tau
MGEHLRNLLICKDSITLKLLEVSAGLKDRYHKQSSRCNAGFLLKALDIANRCDIDYRASNNKRLHVELAMLQMGSLLHQQAAQAPATPTKPVAPQPVKTDEKISKPAYQAGPPPKPIISEPTPKASPPPPPAKAANEPSRIPTTGISIKKSIGAEAAKLAGQEPVTEEGAEDDENPGDAAGSSFTNLQLEKVWEAFAKSVAAQSPNLHATLTQSKPKLVDEARSVVLFTIHSQLQQKEITDHKAELLGFLRNQLDNPKISIQTEMADTFQDDTPYTPMEKYRKMAEKNPNLVKLKEKLNLEIDF